MKPTKKLKMNKWINLAALTMVTVFVLSAEGMCLAAKHKPPAKKTMSKTKNTHYVLGVKQLSGENAKFGVTYTLGKSDPMNITLRSAEYTVEPLQVGDETYVTNANEKLLVLHLIYHNPQKRERSIRWDSFQFTVVDPEGKNHNGVMDLGSEETKANVSMQLKPAQKVYVYGVMTVPAKGEMPKLMIKSHDQLVLRYDLKDTEKKNRVKGLPTLYANPMDESGATPLSQIKGTHGVYYPVGMFHFKLNKFETTSATKIGKYELSDGEKYFIVHFNLKNNTSKPQAYRWDTLNVKLVDSEGVKLGECSDVIRNTSDASYSAQMAPGQELSLRYLFTIPSDSNPKSFSVATREGERVFIYPIE